MSIRDREIYRLVQYAQGLGLIVTFEDDNDDNRNAAEWALDGSEITIYRNSHRSKIGVILSMIHEIGHHVWFIHNKNRTQDDVFYRALSFEGTTPKRYRKKILDVETAGTWYWEQIYKETDMKFPIKKLYIAREIDIWMYEHFHTHNRFPNRPEIRAKIKQVKDKYKS